MNQLQQLDTSVLVDMLAMQTEKLIELNEMHADPDKYEECRQLIEELQKEITPRNNIAEKDEAK
ncbi:MAG: hypothetical protein C4308_01820 [Chitinophagaceae bacterium]